MTSLKFMEMVAQFAILSGVVLCNHVKLPF